MLFIRYGEKVLEKSKITVILLGFLISTLLLIPNYAFTDEFQNNVGKIYWKEDLISLNSFASIVVEDMDMNKKEYPNFADKFKIKLWSDSDPAGLEIEVMETGVYSGIFTGKVFVTDSESSDIRLHVTLGDIIYALYVDNTLPQSYQDESIDLMAASVIKIPGEDMTEYLNSIEQMMKSQKTSVKKVPDWIKNNARWWSEGAISDTEFVSGIQFLVKEEILIVPPTTVSSERQSGIPDWIKNNARWWSEGAISEDDFLNGIQYLIKVGIVSVTDSDTTESLTDDTLTETNPEIAALKSELAACQEIKSNYKRLGCEKPIEEKIVLLEFKEESTQYQAGPITFYYPGIGTLGNEFEISLSGQAILTIRILAENTGSEDNVVLMCTGPAICNYDVWNSDKAFKYSSTDFVSGNIVIKPGQARQLNMLFGPNIGYGGTTFEYDPSKDYFFRVSESWGSVQIPLNLNQE